MSLVAGGWFAEKVAPPTSIFTVSIDGTHLQNIFNVILAFAGAVAVAFIVIGGVKYILSQGESNEIKQARDTILYSLIGIVVVVVAFMLVNFVIGKL